MEKIKVEVNVRSLSDTYEFGRKIYIKLNELALGESNGVLTLGKPAGSDIEQIHRFSKKLRYNERKHVFPFLFLGHLP